MNILHRCIWLQALDTEYQAMKNAGNTQKSEQCQALFAWKNKQATQVFIVTLWFGHVKAKYSQNCNAWSYLLIIFQYQPINSQYWVLNSRSGFCCLAYKHHWEVPINKMITLILACPFIVYRNQRSSTMNLVIQNQKMLFLF